MNSGVRHFRQPGIFMDFLLNILNTFERHKINIVGSNKSIFTATINGMKENEQKENNWAQFAHRMGSRKKINQNQA